MATQNKSNRGESLEEIVIDFGDICRFCLSETTSSISLQDKCIQYDSTDLEVDTIYNFITKMNVIKTEGNENFPSLVCENCYESIKQCYNFFQVCKQSDNSLRDCYERTLKDAKAKLDDQSPEISTQNYLFSEFPIEVNIIEDPLLGGKTPTGENTDKTPKWEPEWKKNLRHSLSMLKAGNINLKYQTMNLSERLKEAQSKLAEDILRSNDLMLGLPNDLNIPLKNDESLYPCPQCSLKFSKADDLKFHYVATHRQVLRPRTVMKFQCRKCVKSFAEQDKLILHYKDVHKTPFENLKEEELNYKVKKTVGMKKRKFYCLQCVPYKIFPTREKLVKHFESFHNVKEKGVKYTSLFEWGKRDEAFKSRFTLQEEFKTIRADDVPDSAPNEENQNLKLFKVYVCTECSPPEIFTTANACVHHKIDIHDKQLENISTKKLSAVYVDSLDVFKQNETDSVGFSFKVICKNCEPAVEFTSTREFVNHMRNLHEEPTLENWEIESKLSGKGESKRESQVWKCSECSTSYFRKQSLYCHMREKHNKLYNPRMTKCPETDCTEYFYSNRQLIQHGISAHQKYFANFHKIYKKKILELSNEEDNRIKNFECDICQRKYVSKNSLRRHILRTHLGKTEVEGVTCPYCGKALSSKLNLKSHIEFIHKALFVSCPVCKKQINFRTIGKHYKTHQTSLELLNPKNLFLCNLCGKTLKSKRGFEDHQKLHKNIRDHLCDICGTGFTTKKFLRLHKKIHEGAQRKMFECHQCDKVFSGRHTLNRHLLTHSGEKNFICEMCSKCFYTLQELNRHVRYHKKEYRFDCQLCDMRFLDKSRFRHHMMRHRNVRPYKCPFCDKMFIVRARMNSHMAAKHNVEVQVTKSVWKDPETYVPLDDLL